MRTLGSFNHPGPDEVPTAILLQRQPSRLRWASIRSIGGPVRVAARAGPFLMERCHCKSACLYKGGQRRASRAPCPPPRPTLAEDGGHGASALAHPTRGSFPTPPVVQEALAQGTDPQSAARARCSATAAAGRARLTRSSSLR